MRTFGYRILSAALALSLLPLATARPADTDKPAAKTTAASEPTKEDLERRIQELEEAVKALRTDTRQLEVHNDEEARNKPPVEWKGDGFTISSADGDYRLKVGGYAQADGRLFLDDQGAGARSQFILRRARINLQGTIFKIFDFRIMPDFGQGQTVLFDAFLVGRFLPEFNLWFGKYKPPVGLERLKSALALDFIERGLPTDLVPNRDIGIMAQGFFFNNAYQYQLGVFNGVQDNGNGNGDFDDDKDFDGRLFATPFKDTPYEPLRGLGIGFSGTYGHHRGSPNTTQLPNYVTSLGQQTFFSYVSNNPPTQQGTAYADGVLYRFSPQAYYYWGAFGALAEYVESAQGVELASATAGAPNIQATVHNDAWQTYFIYVLTGEDAGYNGVTPKANFNPLAGTWGAFQLGFRYGGLKVDNDAFTNGFANSANSANKAQDFTFCGVWYWNRAIQMSLAYGHTIFDGGARNGENRENEDVLTLRSQFAF